MSGTCFVYWHRFGSHDEFRGINLVEHTDARRQGQKMKGGNGRNCFKLKSGSI